MCVCVCMHVCVLSKFMMYSLCVREEYLISDAIAKHTVMNSYLLIPQAKFFEFQCLYKHIYKLISFLHMYVVTSVDYSLI